MTIRYLLLITLLTFASKSLSQETEETIVVQWNNLMMKGWEDLPYYPPITFRLGVIVHTAMFNAWTHYDATAVPTIQTDSFSRQPESERTEANKHAAISYAAYHVLKTLLHEEQSLFDEFMASLGYDTQNIPTEANSPAGIGTLAAQEVLKSRQNDGSNESGDLNPTGAPYSEPVLLEGYIPYVYVNSADDLNDINYWQPLRNDDGTVQEIDLPQWGLITPFALTSGSQFRPTQGPRTTADEASFEAQARQIYNFSQSLTAEQELIAKHWGGELGRRISTWNYRAQQVSERDNHTLDDDVKLFFALNNAVFDGSIAAYDSKRYFNAVRPVTAIRHYFDPNWNSLLVTDADQEYLSNRITTGASAAEVLRRYTGNDLYGGSYTDEETGITLSWETFTDAIEQVADSTLYGGIHFEDSTVVAQEVGTKVGGVVWEKVEGLIEGRS